MRAFLKSTTFAVALTLSGAAMAQDQTGRTSESFAPENAIIDTSIPFAIGAREARQELRGAFGWPTFQEGLVEGVYFRFDPDGYARFAPTPRLDMDVFEVICRPGTLNCMGRKGPISVYLNGQGALQLQVDEIGDGDTFHIVEGVVELPVPRRILGPLDARLETLLGTGGELVVRRGEAEVSRISLTGFSPVAAYLRWITARQDYGVLPRGWPVPNSSVPEGNPIAVNWQVAIPSEQNQPIFERTQPVAPTEIASDMAEVKDELSVLRDLLVARHDAETEGDELLQLAPATPPSQVAQGQSEIETLQLMAQSLMEEIARLQSGVEPQTPALPRQTEPALEVDAAASPLGEPAEDKPGRIAMQLDYLMTEIGLDAETALMIVQSQIMPEDEASSKPQLASASSHLEAELLDADTSESTDVVGKILAELRNHMPEEAQQPRAADPEMASGEFRILTEYFASVFQHSNVAN